MNTSAIHQAIRLNKHPEYANSLLSSKAPLPEGVTDLLRLCASKKRLKHFSETLQVNSEVFHRILINFIEKVLLNEVNSDEKLLGLTKSEVDSDKLKLHYQLLIKIYHPDINPSDHATYQASKISRAYKKLKETKETNAIKLKNITLSRVPPKSYYRATHQAEQQLLGMKTAFMTLSGIAVVFVAITAIYLFQPSKAELIAKPITNSPQIKTQENFPHSNIIDNKFSITSLTMPEENNEESALQDLLRDIESSYENGDVDQIKPILANTPEIRGQSDEQLQAKLETLFKITQERKMLLYDFEWRNISGEIQGRGKFLSRYQMMGEMNWQTRKGIAIISVDNNDGQYQVSSLELENNTIDH